MKICVYDKFDTPERLLNIFKGFVNSLYEKGIQLGSMVIYATTWDKETGKHENLVDEDDDEIVFEIGEFPFVEFKVEGREDRKGLVLFHQVKKGEELSQEEYRQACFAFDKERELAVLLPITRTSKAGNVKTYSTIDEIKKDKFSSYQVLKAIEDDIEYRKYKWSSNKS